MKAQDHLAKAEEIKAGIDHLLKDEIEHVSSIVELAFGMAQHLIAYGMETKHGEHKDVHHGIPSLLRFKDEDEVAISFERLDTLRHGRWYGGKGDGEVIEETMKIIDRIDRWCRD